MSVCGACRGTGWIYPSGVRRPCPCGALARLTERKDAMSLDRAGAAYERFLRGRIAAYPMEMAIRVAAGKGWTVDELREQGGIPRDVIDAAMCV